MRHEYLSFPLEVERGSAIEASSNDLGDVARFGKPNGTGPVEDNGFLAGMKEEFSVDEAKAILKEVYQKVRVDLPANNNSQVSAAAASAMLIKEGVVVRSAGDSGVLVVGDNGKAVLLNQFHTPNEKEIEVLKEMYPDRTDFKEFIMHNLAPGSGESYRDFTDFVSWETLEDTLGTNKFRVIAVSDGLYGKTEEEEVAGHVKELVDGLNIEDSDFSKKLMLKALENTEVFGRKKDDLVILSALRPSSEHSVLLHALDGVGSGKRESAELASKAVDVATKVVREHSEAIYLGEPDSVVDRAALAGQNTTKVVPDIPL